jgi:AcrR family transcriptional regulator
MSSENSRTPILEAALVLMGERDGATVSMAEIAKQAGVSRQAVYLHFQDRANLLIEAARHADEKRGLQKALNFVLSAGDGLESLRRYVRLQARMNPGIWPLARTVDAARRSDADVEGAWQDRLNARLNMCRGLVARLATAPGLKRGLSEEVAADLMWSVTSLRMWEDLVVGRKWSARQYENHVLALLERSLLV